MSRKTEIEALHEERRVLKINTDVEMERITKQLLKLHFKEFVEQYKEVFEKSEQALPSRIRLSYYNEYDDEGGTSPFVGEVYLYDDNENMLDTDLAVLVQSKYSANTYESSLQEQIQEFLHEEFYVGDLEQYIGEESIIF